MKPRTFQTLVTNGISVRAVVEGSGPLCILVHGRPESWYSWRHQIDPLVAAGYRVCMPDVRGYGGSDKPAAIEAYDMRQLTSDVAGLVDALGGEGRDPHGSRLGRADRLDHVGPAPGKGARRHRAQRAAFWPWTEVVDRSLATDL